MNAESTTPDGVAPDGPFASGDLDGAIAAATALVRARPGDAAARVLLAEYLLFTGDFARADTVLAAAEAVDASLALVVVAEFRQLLRAAERRRRLATDGAVPEFLGEPTDTQRALLRARVALRGGDLAGAEAAVAEAEARRAPRPGLRGGAAFDDFRDADDLGGGNLEVLTTTGRYFWIDLGRVASIVPHQPKRPRDLFWRRCTVSVNDGPEGDVYLPALYDAPAAQEPGCEDDALRLGRATAWTEAAPVCGRGQRVFLVGEDGIPLHELGTIEFASGTRP